ncbi:hypothetical protein Bhyg_05976 [Pseudolycoriella hygida]|uniref:Uncharacterized protein n=1 Tax=Pseudolycoriella hygida TaxID=35572 RepID=A0A9Q0MZP5_9DIPT|nr:hypothetical protein Bhyg_05976 [Pseudolycoriella hygida]
MQIKLSFALLLVVTIVVEVQSLWTEFEWIGIENSKSGAITSDVKVTRFNKTTYSLSGTADITVDLNENFDCEAKLFFSSKGDSKYVLQPYKIARDVCCTLMDSTYWKSIESRLREASDIPERTGNEPYCLAFKKNTYTMKQFAFDNKIIPKHFEVGSYKCTFFMYEKESEEVLSTVTFIIRLY